MSSDYRSSIPSDSREQVTKRYPSGRKEMAEYRLGRKLVGVRRFSESGDPEHEHGLKDGVKHGIEYWWFGPGKLDSAEPFVDGLAHGVAKQWDHDGRLLGTYTMTRGTGIDLWRQRRHDGGVFLSEVLPYKDGKRHGFEWWLNDNQGSVYIERRWHEGRLHGVEREWNKGGRLRRGYPRYFVGGVRVTKRQYLKAAASDALLPPFREDENRPARTFPPQIAIHLLR